MGSFACCWALSFFVAVESVSIIESCSRRLESDVSGLVFVLILEISRCVVTSLLIVVGAVVFLASCVVETSKWVTSGSGKWHWFDQCLFDAHLWHDCLFQAIATRMSYGLFLNFILL